MGLKNAHAPKINCRECELQQCDGHQEKQRVAYLSRFIGSDDRYKLPDILISGRRKFYNFRQKDIFLIFMLYNTLSIPPHFFVNICTRFKNATVTFTLSNFIDMKSHLY